jgi:peptidoglycan/xylan/chitin deacetylase (PgdA/CDA1 family)
MKKKQFFLFLLLVTAFFGLYFLGKGSFFPVNLKLFTPQKLAEIYPSQTPTPTPKPLSFSEMNALYGPCVSLPTLMYHHVQNMEEAKGKNQAALTVDTETFRQQMQYLKDRGYKSAYMSDVINFFEGGAAIAPKSILITFDDGYDDFAANAVPILREFGFASTLFVSTGLMNNPGYLSWNTIEGLKTAGDVVFANHTWSHRNVGANRDDVEREIKTADLQLQERGLNSPKIFAYPYGIQSDWGKTILQSLGYGLGFTTRPGSILCAKQRLELPRVRVGNSPLGNYGL